MTYHPTLGRWVQRDPAGYVDGMGLYEYALSSPSGYLDPAGQDALPPPGAPMGQHTLKIIPTKGHAAIADEIVAKMQDMCPCFDYPRKRAGGSGEEYVGIARSSSSEYESHLDFCCCYYRHLPACNLFYLFAKGGLAKKRGPQYTVKYGTQAQLGPSADLRMRGAAHTIAEEMVHGVYGTNNEYSTNAAASLVAKTAPTTGTSKKPDRHQRNIVAELDNLLNRSSEFRGRDTE